jgi:hypothetical protein
MADRAPICAPVGSGLQRATLSGDCVSPAEHLMSGTALACRDNIRPTRGERGDMQVLSEFMRFLFGARSRLILLPFVFFLLLFAIMFVLVEGTAWAPFVYALF